MRNMQTGVLAGILVLSTAGVALADEVHLRDGSRIEGQAVAWRDVWVVVDRPNHYRVIPAEAVDGVVETKVPRPSWFYVEESVEGITDTRRDPPEARAAGLHVVFYPGPRAMIEDLAGRLAGYLSESERERIVEAIRGTGDRGVVEMRALFARVGRGGDATVETGILRALAAFGTEYPVDNGTVERLAILATGEFEEPVRHAAADTLRALDVVTPTRILRDIHGHHGPERAERAAAAAARIGDARAVRAMIEEFVVLTAGPAARAHMMVVTQQAYIRDYTLITNQGIAAADPEIGYVQTGVVHDIHPILITSYRRYLYDLTGMEFRDAADALRWWRKNGHRFRERTF